MYVATDVSLISYNGWVFPSSKYRYLSVLAVGRHV